MSTNDKPSYAALRIHTNHSIAEGAIRAKALGGWLREAGIPAAAMCDTDSMSGAYEFSESLWAKGVQPIIGVQATLMRKLTDENGMPGVETFEAPLYAGDERGYKALVKLLSSSLCADTKGIDLGDMITAARTEGFFMLTGGPKGPICAALARGDEALARTRLNTLRRAFGDRLYVEIRRQRAARSPGDAAVEATLVKLADEMGIALIATSEAWYETPDDHESHDILLAIAEGATIYHENRRRSDAAGYLKTPADMAALFADLPEALENSLLFARRCAFRLTVVAPMLPRFETGKGESEDEALDRMAREGLLARLGLSSWDQVVAKKPDYAARLDYEIGTIKSMGFPGYFLIVSDFIGWAKDQDIPVGPGRGSGAGSLVAWSLRITDLDPIRFGLYFERFLNPDRVSMPDFDIDFCQQRREEVIAYVKVRYGEERVCQIGTMGKLQARAVIRDVSRVMAVPYMVADRFCQMIPNNPAAPVTLEQAVDIEPLASALANAEDKIRKVFEIGMRLEGLYRHLSTHAAGVVIADRPVAETVPVYRDQHGQIVSCFDMKAVEKAGLVKFDFLGLKTLDIIQNAIAIEARAGRVISTEDMGLEDPDTYEMLRAGDAYGVFQLESAGMRKAMLQIQPTSIEDIIALVSLYRPGPMDSIPVYADVKAGIEAAEYLHPLMEETLSETYGVIVYQEQVMKLAQDLAGYSLGGADLLRRAMGKKIKAEMDQQRAVFTDGARDRGIAPHVATEIFDLIAKFANYGFNKSHAAAYAVISYQTAWLKKHAAEAFAAASMNYDISDIDKIADWVGAIRESGLVLRRPDVNEGEAMFSLSAGGAGNHRQINYALGALKGVGDSMASAIADERRKGGRFINFEEFVIRMGGALNKKALEALIQGGALDTIGGSRKAMLEIAPKHLALAAREAKDAVSSQGSLFDLLPPAPKAKAMISTDQDWASHERAHRQFAVLGHFLDQHPAREVRAMIKEDGGRPIRTIADVKANPPGKRDVPLLVVATDVTYKRTKADKPMMIIKACDETGSIELLAFSDTVDEIRAVTPNPKGMLLRVTTSVSARDNEDAAFFIRDIELVHTAETLVAA